MFNEKSIIPLVCPKISFERKGYICETRFLNEGGIATLLIMGQVDPSGFVNVRFGSVRNDTACGCLLLSNATPTDQCNFFKFTFAAKLVAPHDHIKLVEVAYKYSL